ncbi:MAG: Putative exosome complex RNA-binding protein [Candidatus Parvarchaeum acidiphilum ARMAN-4_'5-way FS']|uniref:Putative exosome complex RNA-binding protein n=1 Tax=Candidatus Parvarchaeum acidiphilum ARMAN-4_'5-way FS' TaxID=994837 RepID=F2UTS6_PARA4|nr:MAG: Putative exosome complex RNA-binding protein [Candidatus Parvarchaeum acidiphilum ARMAN-4_'5-way FS']
MTLENYNYIRELAEKKIRLDQRSEFEGRKITIKDNVIHLSDGSAYVEIGGTKVMAGVKVLNGTPFPDRQNEGALVVNFEASELATNYNDDRINYSIEVGRSI